MSKIAVNLTDYGMIEEGDSLIIVDNRNKLIKATARTVLNKSFECEEIVINKAKNKYFIVDMFLNGMSWVKGCIIIKKNFKG